MKLKLGTRRIQMLRGSGFLYLPKFWVSQRGIKKGDVMQIDLLPDGALKISPLEAP